MKDKRRSDPEKLGGKRGFVPVEVEKTLYQKITSHAEKQNMTIKQYVSIILSERFEKEEMIKEISPKLNILEFSTDSIIVRDNHVKQSRFAMIEIREGRLWCELEQSFDCQHIRYVLTLSNLSKIKDRLKHI